MRVNVYAVNDSRVDLQYILHTVGCLDSAKFGGNDYSFRYIDAKGRACSGLPNRSKVNFSYQDMEFCVNLAQTICGLSEDEKYLFLVDMTLTRAENEVVHLSEYKSWMAAKIIDTLFCNCKGKDVTVKITTRNRAYTHSESDWKDALSGLGCDGYFDRMAFVSFLDIEGAADIEVCRGLLLKGIV